MTKLEKKLMAEIEELKTRIAALEARPYIATFPTYPIPSPRPWQPVTYPYTTCGSGPTYLNAQTVRHGELTSQSFQNTQ
jgi:hypothetical protein